MPRTPSAEDGCRLLPAQRTAWHSQSRESDLKQTRRSFGVTYRAVRQPQSPQLLVHRLRAQQERQSASKTEPGACTVRRAPKISLATSSVRKHQFIWAIIGKYSVAVILAILEPFLCWAGSCDRLHLEARSSSCGCSLLLRLPAQRAPHEKASFCRPTLHRGEERRQEGGSRTDTHTVVKKSGRSV